jgi:nitrate reductase gamma subunit
MSWIYWVLYAALAICLMSFAYHFIRLVRLGKPRDLSRKAGNTGTAIVYSFTSAMSPKNKESAFLHLPTYTAGIVYHIATFLSLAAFVLILLEVHLAQTLLILFIITAFAGSISGLAILIKRMADKKLRKLSNPDDYISNLLVTLFQVMTGLALLFNGLYPIYILFAALLFLYMPIGKLKHIIYFFAARYHLGFFYGWRNVWPPG